MKIYPQFCLGLLFVLQFVSSSGKTTLLRPVTAVLLELTGEWETGTMRYVIFP